MKRGCSTVASLFFGIFICLFIIRNIFVLLYGQPTNTQPLPLPSLGITVDEFQRKFNATAEAAKFPECKIDRLELNKNMDRYEAHLPDNVLICGKLKSNETTLCELEVICDEAHINAGCDVYLLMIKAVQPDLSDQDMNRIMDMFREKVIYYKGFASKSIHIAKIEYRALFYENSEQAVYFEINSPSSPSYMP